jgi:hypothetical protein
MKMVHGGFEVAKRSIHGTDAFENANSSENALPTMFCLETNP